MAFDLDSERIRLYRESISQAWGHGDSNVWPVKLNAAFHLFLKEFGEELLDDIAWLEQRGKTLEEIAAPFYNPARLYRIIDSTIYSMRQNRIRVAEQRAVVLKLLSMAKTLKHGSEFNEDGRNVIYDPPAVWRILAQKPRLAAAPAESQLLHRFSGIMWAYTEAIFFRAHDVTKEIHGPYFYNGGRKQFIVKEYLNLRPVELWPGMPLLPYNTIKLFKHYNDGLRLRIDALNHLYQDGASPVASLESYCVEIDGQLADARILKDFLAIAQQTVTAISRYIDGLTWNERVSKYADIFWFRKKPFRDQRGLDWHVPEHVRRTVMAGSENVRRQVKLSDEASARLAMLTI
jgi:hypothetical protein